MAKMGLIRDLQLLRMLKMILFAKIGWLVAEFMTNNSWPSAAVAPEVLQNHTWDQLQASWPQFCDYWTNNTILEIWMFLSKK